MPDYRARCATLPSVIVGGVKTTRLSRYQICELLRTSYDHEMPEDRLLLFDVNGHGLALKLFDKEYRSCLEESDVIHADGQPIVIASKILTRTPIAERSATTDLIDDIAGMASQSSLSFYLFGGTESVNRKCCEILTSRYPGLKIVGRRNGYYSPKQEDEICDEIRSSGADILWVGLGKPKEQYFCARNRHKIGRGWAISCGGCFNFVVGEYPRAPHWMQGIGLEWLYRTIKNPRKLFLRYAVTNPVGLFLLVFRTKSTGNDSDN